MTPIGRLEKQTSQDVKAMSALPLKADMDQHRCDVRFVPKADICSAAKERLFHHLVGTREQRWRNDTEHSCSRKINDEIEFRR